MYPWLPHHFPTYYALWAVAAVLAFVFGGARARSAGFPMAKSLFAILCLAVLLLVGSKLLYLVESLVFPRDEVLAVLSRSGEGFRIPGGVLLCMLALPPLCARLSLPWRRFADAMMLVLLACIVVIRVGCFLNGCCFGRPSDLPWAVRFPVGSFAFHFQVAHRLIYPIEPGSLPVHPLQLYFAAAAGLGAIGLWLVERRRLVADGTLFLLGGIFFFGSTAGLELLRGSLLTLNAWLTPLAAAFCILLLYGRTRAEAAISA